MSAIASRPGSPLERIRVHLESYGIGLPGQRVLDLGTGDGELAFALARIGCQVAGVDRDPGAIDAASRRAAAEGLPVEFRLSPAEATGLGPASFDAAVACRSWTYFDPDRAAAEAERLLQPDGRLVIAHFWWLPELDPVARGVEQVVRRHNPRWNGAPVQGEGPPRRRELEGRFRRIGYFQYDGPVPYTRAGLVEAIGSCRGVATLLPFEREAFDRDLTGWLAASAPDPLSILYRFEAEVYALRQEVRA